MELSRGFIRESISAKLDEPGEELPQHEHDCSRQSLPDWDIPEDADNPRNFPLATRTFTTAAVTLLAFVSTFAASVYAPAQDPVMRAFLSSTEVAVLPLSLFNLGMAFGPLLGGPLSETYGRKAVFLASSPIFAFFILGAGLSKGIASLAVCRFLAGIFAAPAISNASATIADFTASRQRGLSLGIYYTVPTFGAVCGPLIGGLVVQAGGWRWTQWTTLFFLVGFYIPVCFVKETYKKRILQQRAKRRGYDAPSQKRSAVQKIRHFATVLIARPVHMLLTEPIVTLVCGYGGFLFGLQYSFVVAVPRIFEHYYNFDESGQALSFLPLMVGTALAPIPLVLIDSKMYQPRLRRWHQLHDSNTPLPQETRLFPAMLTSLGLPTSLFIFAWTAQYRIHWIVPMVFQGLAMCSSVLIYAGSNLYMVDAYGPLFGASASSAAMLTRYILSAAFPLFTLQMYEALGVGWATSLLAFCTLGMAPIPWLFWTYGAKLRERSRYETSQ